VLEIVLASGFVVDSFSHSFVSGTNFMARICELTGKRPTKGSRIWRSGKAKKKGGIGMHVTAITKRRYLPNLQRVRAVVDGEVKYIRVSTRAIKRGLVTKPAPRNWKKGETAKAA
jgi:large subunit ribosomal protein L28